MTQLRHLPGQHDQSTHGHGGGGDDLAGTERSIRGLRGGETVAVFDMDGKPVLRKTQMGDPDGPGPRAAGVDFTDDEVRQMKGGWVLTHNHPGGWEYPADDPRRAGSSFSGPDVLLAAQTGMMELRAVAPGATYSLKPGPKGWGDINDIRIRHEFTTMRVVDTFTSRIMGDYVQHGVRPWGSTREERTAHAEAEHSHEVMTRLSAEMGWTYTRTPA